VRAVRRRASIALVAVAALLATAAIAWAVTPKPDTYEGKTGQNKAVFVKVDDKSRIKAFLIEYRAKCKQAEGYGGSIQDKDRKGDRITQQNGVFSGTAKKTDDLGSGYKGHASLTYDGKFTTATAANGSATIKVKVTKNGDKVDSCSRTTKWHVPT
jgi:hypothetical protein